MTDDNTQTAATDWAARTKPFTSQEFLESLRDGREIWIYGERVKDVTTHPATRGAAHEIARLYDLQHDPEHSGTLTFAPPDGRRQGMAYFVPKSPDDLGRLPSEMEIAIFRIVQECLTNIHRHSGSATAVIRIQKEGNNCTVQVRDFGRGIPEEKQREMTGSGLGFGGMRERLRQLGGTLQIKSDSSGTLINAVLKVA